jgi:hypothetical protein
LAVVNRELRGTFQEYFGTTTLADSGGLDGCGPSVTGSLPEGNEIRDDIRGNCFPEYFNQGLTGDIGRQLILNELRPSIATGAGTAITDPP